MEKNKITSEGLILSNISFWVENKTLRKKHTIIDTLSLYVKPGEFVTFHGRSGCGKTTLMNIISGLITPSSGKVLLNGCEIKGPSKDIAFVFQESALYPYLTVRENIELGMKMNGVSKKERYHRVNELLKKVGLSEHDYKYSLRNKLSGGMKQRVEIASVLADESKVIIMDEPFGALDSQTRGEMETLILQVWKDFGKIVLFVTHNKNQALILSDKIVLMPHNNTTPIEEIEIDLPRPRNETDLKFIEYQRILYNHLK